MSSAKNDRFDRMSSLPINTWYERLAASKAETEAFVDAFLQERAKTRLAAATPPLPNVRPVISTPTASSPGALPVEGVAEYLHSDPNGPEIQLASMIVDQQLEAEAAVAAAARMKADEERSSASAAAPNRPTHDWSSEALMEITLRPRYALHYSGRRLMDEFLGSEHSDPAEAIRACDSLMMFITVGDRHAQELLDAEKTHQIKLLADQAEETRKLRRAEKDKNRKRELRAVLVKATQRIDYLRSLTVRVDTTAQALVSAPAGGDTDADQALVQATASVDTDYAEQAAVVAAASVDTAGAEQAPVAAVPGVDSTDAEQALVAAPAGADITDTEQTLPSRYKVYRRCVNDYVDEVLVSEHFAPADAISACGKEMFITAADGHSRKLLDAEKTLQIIVLADQAEMMHDPLLEAQRDETPRGKRPVSKLLASKLLAEKAEVIQRIASIREVQVFADTNAAQQTLVVAEPSHDPEGKSELTCAFFSAGDEFYKELIFKSFRVGRSIMVLPSGTEEVIRNCHNQGGAIGSRVIIRRSNGLPQPVSGPAAAIFQHFMKIQYRDVRSSVIQQVLKDYVEGGEALDAKSEFFATGEATLAFWLHCAETRKPCVCLEDEGEDNDGQTLSRISVYCPQGFCFHPDVFFYISEILLLYAQWGSADSSGIDVSAKCVGEAGEKAAQAIIKLFADTPGLLVKDMLFARYF